MATQIPTASRSSSLDRTQAGAKNVADILNILDIFEETGLSSKEVQRRRKQYGANRLREAQSQSAVQIFVDQFKSGIVVMLLAAVGLSLLFGDLIEALAIAVVIIINGLIGFFTELKAVRSMEALQKMGNVEATVYRDGEVQTISADDLVPGDLLILDSGDVITADVRLTEASRMQVDESALTGESVPVDKQTDPISEDVPLAEQANMVFKGTAITRGSGKGVVVSTGMNTELGQISSLVQEAEEEVTPLEQRLDALGRKLIWVTIGVAALVGLSGLIGGKDFFLMIQTAIALAIAAIPEGLPIVATIALARGMRRMAKRHALINKLSAVETLGSTTVICTDKTGTLTLNQMTVTQVVLESGTIQVSDESSETQGPFLQNDQPVDPAEHQVLTEALQVGVLCNNAALSKQTNDSDEQDEESTSKTVGDPMEVALLAVGAKADMQRPQPLETFPEVREVAFDPDAKMMATYHETSKGNGFRVAVKGAPEAVVEVCTQIRTNDGTHELSDKGRQKWLQKNTEMAENGLRVLAIASKTADAQDEDPYQNLTLIGFLGMLDPPRKDVRESIELCHQAGIRVIMVTGDQSITARNVGQAVGLVTQDNARATEGKDLKEPQELSSEDQERLREVPIFSRVSPKQKLNLIALHQQHGQIVAMTGDGVNDAPALEKADIGIAMGKHGTQVAREAADMILKDDAFSTILEAVRYGRVIFGNIRKFVMFLLSGNAGEIFIVGLATLFNAPLPLLPLQILFLNFIADVFPALALGVGVGTGEVMHHAPRNPKEPVMTTRHWMAIIGYGVLIAASVLTAFALAFYWLDASTERAVTISFLTLSIARLWHVFNMRDYDTNLFSNEVTRNPWVWGALVLCLALILSAVFIPFLAQILQLVMPGFFDWVLILGMSLVPFIVGQTVKLARLGYHQ